ncbi:SIS domain-containing protein [Gammaproteobacteria bacterium]|jgi:D-sedoheptulose 7-phosphate isomerase|nr:SIS domain-containing protein [Gammaproteobacteria bacterium]
MKFTVESYIKQHNLVIENLDIQEIENGIQLIMKSFKEGKRIAVCGNGGSATTASHFITDWNKMVHIHTGMRFDGICLSDNIGIVTAYANDLSYDDIFSEQVKNLLNKDDLLITLSGSGNSGNVVKATNIANEMGVNTLTICGYDGGKLKKVSKNSIWIRSMDMQICEDAQIVFGHMVMKELCNVDITN